MNDEKLDSSFCPLAKDLCISDRCQWWVETVDGEDASTGTCAICQMVLEMNRRRCEHD